MRVALFCTPSTRSSLAWVLDHLARQDRVCDPPQLVESAGQAGGVGHQAADAWTTAMPDVVLALGWEAGLAGLVAAREHDVPVAVRLSRAGRNPGSDEDRLQLAVARSGALVLVPSAGEMQRLADRGVHRDRLRVVPDAVDRAHFADRVATVSGDEQLPRRVAVLAGSLTNEGLLWQLRAAGGVEPVPVNPRIPTDELAAVLRSCSALVLADDTDDEVALALRAMSCAVPVVAVDHGVLSDVVADQVTGLLVAPGELGEALRSLLSEPMRRVSLGLAAVDRVAARFTPEVAGAALERALLEVARPALVG